MMEALIREASDNARSMKRNSQKEVMLGGQILPQRQRAATPGGRVTRESSLYMYWTLSGLGFCFLHS